MSEQEPAATSPDLVFELLSDAVSEVVRLDTDPAKADGFVRSLADFISSLKLPTAPDGSAVDHCKEGKMKLVTVPLCAQFDLSTTQSDADFDMAEGTAAGELRSAASAWRVARQTYTTGKIIAKGVLDEAIKEAKNTYDQKLNDGVRNQNRHTVMMISVFTAVAAYQTTVAQLGSTLAGAAGAMLAAYGTYAAAVLTANATKNSADAGAEEVFWDAVEKARDAL